jgi:hypothetical protein
METAELPRHRTVTILAICAAIYAAYFPVALWLGRIYVPIEKPPGEMVQLISKIEHVEGFAYQAPTPFLITYADNDPANQRSPIILYENMTPLGPPHSAHHDIQEIGRGRYSHWNGAPDTGLRTVGGVLFSASDNSDPRTNGRRYWVGLPR